MMVNSIRRCRTSSPVLSLGYVDYDKDYPAKIDFIPQDEVMNAYRLDYESNMVDGYIYGKAKSLMS